MKTKTLMLGIDKFPASSPHIKNYSKKPKEIAFSIKDLFHHYWLVKYDDNEPHPTVYEYEKFLAACNDWRFKGAGIGRDKESKRNVSNELGKAFTRWFLYNYENLTYFSPFEEHFKTKYPDGSYWEKKTKGDLPDFLCGTNDRDIRLAEAKGRYSSVSFTNKEFDEFREQIQRVVLKNSANNLISVKGYISACQWATEETPRTKTKLLVEDPDTDGEFPEQEGYSSSIGLRMISHHYVTVLERLMLHSYAESLQNEYRITNPIGHTISVWEVALGPMKGRRFVGGIIDNKQNNNCDCYFHGYNIKSHILRPPQIIFALDQKIFEHVIIACRNGIDSVEYFPQLDAVAGNNSNISIHRDGTLIAPESYMIFVGEIQI